VFNESPPPDGTPEIWVMNANGSNQHLVLAETNYSENRPSFSPDGSKIVFGRCKLLVLDGDTCAIYTIGVNGVGLTPITSFLLDTTQRSPMFSPDGTKIAFIRSNDTAAGFLGVTYLVNADGSNLHRITPPEPCFIRPDWSPDGTTLTAFTHFCNPQPEEIAVINSDGSGLKYLTHNGMDYFGGPHDRTPSFSPDGNFIVFERNAPDFSSSAIYVMKLDGSGEKLVTAVHPSGHPKPHRSLLYETASRLTKVEEGGSTPRWGVAPE
jgi:Tol biopolymer transport system component